LQLDAKWEWKVTNSQTVEHGLPKIQMQMNMKTKKNMHRNTYREIQINQINKMA